MSYLLICAIALILIRSTYYIYLFLLTFFLATLRVIVRVHMCTQMCTVQVSISANNVLLCTHRIGATMMEGRKVGDGTKKGRIRVKKF